MFLTGGGSALRGFRDLAAKNFKVEVIAGNPFEKVEVVVAGGMENMTRAPLITHPCFNTMAEGGKERVEKVFEKHGYDAMLQDGLWDAFEFEKHMGVLAEMTAKELGITREDADRFAYLSHKRAWATSNSEAFNNYIVHVPIISMPLAMTRCDETLWHPSPEKLASLGPVFAKDGVITAGNASQLADGATCRRCCRGPERRGTARTGERSAARARRAVYPARRFHAR